MKTEYFQDSYVKNAMNLNPLQMARIEYLSSLIRKLQQEGFILELEEPIIDVGTGVGIGIAVLRNLGLKNLYGIDTNKESLEKAINDGRLERRYAIAGDARKLSEYFPEEYFGTITSFNAPIVLGGREEEHTNYGFYADGRVYKFGSKRIIPSPWEREIPQEIGKVLKPNGVVLFTVMTEYEAEILTKAFGRIGIEGCCRKIQEEFPYIESFIYVGKK